VSVGFWNILLELAWEQTGKILGDCRYALAIGGIGYIQQHEARNQGLLQRKYRMADFSFTF
jgi:hypothetical protein